MNASPGSSRPGTPTSASPSGSSAGRSLAECTPRSASPSRIARSTPRTNRALSPTSPSAVFTATTSAPPSAAATALGLGERQGAAARPQPRLVHRPRPRCFGAALVEVARPRRRDASSGSLDGSRPNSSRSDRDLHVGVGLVGVALQPQRRLVQEAGCDRVRRRAQPLAVGIGQPLPALLVLGEDPVDDLVGAGAQRGDRRGHVLSREPAVEARQLGAQDALGPARLGLPARDVSLDERLEVVHVVEADAGDLAARRVDVARDREIDQEQRPAVARSHHLGQRLALDDVVRRVGGGDDDVGVGELLGQLLEADRVARRSAGRGRSRGRSGGWR